MTRGGKRAAEGVGPYSRDDKRGRRAAEGVGPYSRDDKRGKRAAEGVGPYSRDDKKGASLALSKAPEEEGRSPSHGGRRPLGWRAEAVFSGPSYS